MFDSQKTVLFSVLNIKHVKSRRNQEKQIQFCQQPETSKNSQYGGVTEGDTFVSDSNDYTVEIKCRPEYGKGVVIDGRENKQYLGNQSTEHQTEYCCRRGLAK
jgi:hypothetical protein